MKTKKKVSNCINFEISFLQRKKKSQRKRLQPKRRLLQRNLRRKAMMKTKKVNCYLHSSHGYLEEEEAPGKTLKGMVFAISGTLSLKRDDVIAAIAKHKGEYASSITKKVTHLIVGKCRPSRFY
jgi:NAD-dependent DNA ligase